MKKFWLLFSQSVTVLLAAYFVVGTLKPEWLGRHAGSSGTVAIMEAPSTTPGSAPAGSFRLAARKAAAAVVSINTSKAAQKNLGQVDPFFKFFFHIIKLYYGQCPNVKAKCG